MAKTKKIVKKYFIEVDEDGDAVNVYDNEDDVKGCCSGGDIVLLATAVKKFKLVDESVKLVEIK